MPTIKARFSLDYEDWKIYQEKLTLFPEKVKKATNEFLHNDARVRMIESITGEMPESDRNKTGPRGHARREKWYVSFNFDQKVDIENKLAGKRYTSFYYLFYPHEGTKYIIRPNPFMERAIKKENDYIVTGLFNAIDCEIREEL